MSDNIVNLFEKTKEKKLTVLERVENCTWHVINREEQEAKDCDYCNYRSAMSEKIFRQVVSETINDAKKYSWDLTTLDIKFILAETIEKVMDLEQEMVIEQKSGTGSKGALSVVEGREPKASETSGAIEKRDGEVTGTSNNENKS